MYMAIIYSRLQKVETWTKEDLCVFSFFPWFGVGGRPCSNFPAFTVHHGSHRSFSGPCRAPTVRGDGLADWYHAVMVFGYIQA